VPAARRNAGAVEGRTEKLADGVGRRLLLDRQAEVRPFLARFGAPEVEEAQAWLSGDLEAIVAEVRAAGALPLLLSYPVDDGRLGQANAAIERAARATGARLIDPRPAFRAGEELVAREALLFHDLHPTALGYGLLARVVLAALAEEGLVSLAGALDLHEELRGWRAPELTLAPWLEDGRTIGFVARYAPGHRVQFVVSGRRGGFSARWQGALKRCAPARGECQVPVAPDELALASIDRPGRYLIAFDTRGECHVRFDEQQLAALAEGRELWATCVLIHPGQKLGRVATPLCLP
jgi:hypothetical protein